MVALILWSITKSSYRTRHIKALESSIGAQELVNLYSWDTTDYCHVVSPAWNVVIVAESYF